MTADAVKAAVVLMVESKNFTNLTKAQYASVQMTLKNAVLRALKSEGKEVNASNFNKHPVFSLWKKQGIRTVLNVPDSVDKELLQQRLALAFEVFSPDEFVKKVGDIQKGADFIRNPEDAAASIKNKANQMPVEQAVKDELAEAADQLSRKLEIPETQTGTWYDEKFGMGETMKKKPFDNVQLGWAKWTGWTDQLNGELKWGAKIVPNSQGLVKDQSILDSIKINLDEADHLHGVYVKE